MKRLTIGILLFLCLPLSLFAQTTGKISGSITDDKTGEPLIGVNVMVEGTQLGAASDINGKYFILNVDPKNNTTYNPRVSLSFTGNTGPYLLYTYARISNILKKAKYKKTVGKISTNCLHDETAHKIIMSLAEFEDILKKSLENYDPSELTKYLYNLAKNFSSFYRDSHVLGANKEDKKARLFFLSCIKEVMGRGLKMLGIKPLERM